MWFETLTTLSKIERADGSGVGLIGAGGEVGAIHELRLRHFLDHLPAPSAAPACAMHADKRQAGPSAQNAHGRPPEGFGLCPVGH